MSAIPAHHSPSGSKRSQTEVLSRAVDHRYAPSVRRSEALDFFSAHRQDLERLGISSLLVFGSVARDEARPDSDVDLIAVFDRPIGYMGLIHVERELEQLLGRAVDLATPGMIRQEFRDRIYAEAVRAA